MNKLLYCLAAFLLLGSVANASHPYHVSLSEVERNLENGNLEVSMCLWPADLEKALSQMTDTVVDLDTAENLDELIVEYLKKRIAFSNADGELAEIRFVGHEIDLKKGWLYFEVKTGKTESTWQFENRVFFELNEDQSNHINLKVNRRVTSATCTLDTPSFQLN